MSVDVITIEDLRDLIRNLPTTVQARQKHYRPGPYRGRPASNSLAPPFTSLGTASTAGSKRPRSGSSVSDLYFYDSYPVALFEAVVHSLPRPELVHKAVPETDIDGVGSTLAGLTFRRSNSETPLGKVQPLTIRILDNLLRHQDVKRDIEELLDAFDVRHLAKHRNPSLDPQILQKLNECKRNYDGELDEYKVYHMINKGTFGVVYGATKGDVDVAIKMVSQVRYSRDRVRTKLIETSRSGQQQGILRCRMKFEYTENWKAGVSLSQKVACRPLLII